MTDEQQVDEQQVWVVTHNLTPEINNVIMGVFSSLEKAEQFIGEMGTSRSSFRVNPWKVDADAD